MANDETTIPDEADIGALLREQAEIGRRAILESIESTREAQLVSSRRALDAIAGFRHGFTSPAAVSGQTVDEAVSVPAGTEAFQQEVEADVEASARTLAAATDRLSADLLRTQAAVETLLDGAITDLANLLVLEPTPD